MPKAKKYRRTSRGLRSELLRVAGAGDRRLLVRALHDAMPMQNGGARDDFNLSSVRSFTQNSAIKAICEPSRSRLAACSFLKIPSKRH
jgi:hypothetical protein